VIIKPIVEGSEDQATGGLERCAEAHPELLAADASLIGDAGNFRPGPPTVTASLIDGLPSDGEWDGLDCREADCREADFREDVGLLDGVGLRRQGSVSDRL
jgi:hypothetical protein